MLSDAPAADVLLVVSGLLWTATYLLIIRRGFADGTYGMPLVALCANLSWEFIFAFIFPHTFPQRAVDFVWLGLDLVIFAQLLYYGPREFGGLGRGSFYALTGLALVTAFCTVLLVSVEFDDLEGVYSAFGQNLMMSVLFVSMLYQRESGRGQSLPIAVCKLGGTAFASLSFLLFAAGRAESSVLLPFLYASIFVFDLIYAGMLASWRKARSGGGPAG